MCYSVPQLPSRALETTTSVWKTSVSEVGKKMHGGMLQECLFILLMELVLDSWGPYVHPHSLRSCPWLQRKKPVFEPQCESKRIFFLITEGVKDGVLQYIAQ